jgi:hypothetical protein
MVKKCTSQEFLEKGSNTIGYEMGSSSFGVYTMAKTPHVDNFKDG